MLNPSWGGLYNDQYVTKFVIYRSLSNASYFVTIVAEFMNLCD